jgi:outer membrane lipoprotein-sorting protein
MQEFKNPVFMKFRSFLYTALIFLVLPTTGCLLRSRSVEPRTNGQPLKIATQEELVQYVNTEAARIHSMRATVNIDASVGGEKKGKITDYEEIRGFVLVRKPAMLRMKGLLPVVRTTAFDMVSNGSIFKLWIPPKNRFIEGKNDVATPNIAQPLENMRPQQIYDALLLPQINKEGEIAVVENGSDHMRDSKGREIEQADYVLHIIGKDAQGNPHLQRNIIFSRIDLLPHQQIIFDDNGNVVTDVRYQAYKDFDGVNFPAQIEIWRPQEEYDITLHILKLELNLTLADDDFQLVQPSGAQVLHLDHPQSNVAHFSGNSGMN